MRVLFVLGGGIGNIIQATPAIKAVALERHKVDLLLHCNSSREVQNILSIPAVSDIFCGNNTPKNEYYYQANGPFTPVVKYKAKHFIKPQISYANHIPEAEVYYNLAQQMGVTISMPETEVAKIKEGPCPKHKNTIAIYPGSKPNWAMKRWDKYDKLAERFDHVAVIGTKEDINSHGNPSWIKKEWRWPEHVDFVTGSLKDMVHFLYRCKAFIGNDGGLAHVAAATKIPTFVIFGPSSHIKNKPYTNNAYVVGADIHCRPCQFKTGPDGQQIFAANKASCLYGMQCMSNLTVDDVLDQIKSNLPELINC